MGMFFLAGNFRPEEVARYLHPAVLQRPLGLSGVVFVPNEGAIHFLSGGKNSSSTTPNLDFRSI